MLNGDAHQFFEVEELRIWPLPFVFKDSNAHKDSTK